LGSAHSTETCWLCALSDAAVQDRAGGVDLIRHVRALFPRIGIIVANSAYAGRFDRAGGPMVGCPGCRRPDLASAFVLLSTRRRVEQAFGAGWFCLRLLVDHEPLPHVAESMIRIGSIARFVHALAA
jgi:hypothetical protein